MEICLIEGTTIWLQRVLVFETGADVKSQMTGMVTCCPRMTSLRRLPAQIPHKLCSFCGHKVQRVHCLLYPLPYFSSYLRSHILGTKTAHCIPLRTLNYGERNLPSVRYGVHYECYQKFWGRMYHRFLAFPCHSLQWTVQTDWSKVSAECGMSTARAAYVTSQVLIIRAYELTYSSIDSRSWAA